MAFHFQAHDFQFKTKKLKTNAAESKISSFSIFLFPAKISDRSVQIFAFVLLSMANLILGLGPVTQMSSGLFQLHTATCSPLHV